ncbi:sulfate ABC transporter permease subunit [Flexivirga oryzae]|uniref:Sulfate transport system permease protein n=1 Tax=Flexivirga oryzae TaxID=1794944 RepID=A0A839MXT4_9MICO|nr:sulfate transport system permease protein [Flexivirga oryzae]
MASAVATRGRRGRIGLRALALGYVGILVAVPLVVIVARVIGDGWTELVDALTSPTAVTAYRLTLEVSVVAVVLNAVFGVVFGILLTRYRVPGSRLLSALADLPVAVSPIIAGLALVLVYGPVDGWFGAGLADSGIQVIYALPGMILATTFVSFPLVLREVVPVLQEAGTEMEQAAKVLGASAWQQFVRITLPTIRPALVYGLVLSLARSLGEFGAVRVVSGGISGDGQTQTLTLLIQDKYQQLEGGTYQIALLLVVITVAAIVTASLRKDKRGTT